MKYNLHTHSFYCGHGSGKLSEYLSEAERNGFGLLGFSEHCPFPDSFLSRSRMGYWEMEVYENDVRSLRSDIPVLLGYEVDYMPARIDYFKALSERVDYLIGATHFIFRQDGTMASVFGKHLSEDDILRYADRAAEAIASGLFSFFAHPDVFLSSYEFGKTAERATEIILDAAVSFAIPLELNGNGYLKGRGYPSAEFWKRAGNRGIHPLLSSDAHQTKDLAKPFDFLHGFARDLGLSLIEPASLYPLTFRMGQEM
ncbi:MAG: histidinol-phosphatase [Spirochaetes bacterium]|uniref:Histidinol-phosphatase n=1 Tax=Candidatus Ornithospirochaeta stercoripullorum TaxID=2840899 RepID=A0A9D9DZY2_9SPIO|nr:histidinol-phosphatase [Candidatus Ornithospirochaeta stercoripullorum]